MSATFICSHCGQEHSGLPTDWGFNLPDEIHALPYLSRYVRTRYNNDLCTMDESRFFIRTLLSIPLLDIEENEHFSWGVWIEVDKSTHDLYMTSWNQDISSHTRGSGNIANEISVYGGTMGLSVEIEYNAGTDRPSVWLAKTAQHALAHEQFNGITGKRHHDILQALGHFGDKGDA